jgi:23S rRNA pseudouridine1911/1915/1917 synthase
MLDILYEDDALIFIDKPAGIVVQQRMHNPDEPYLHALVQQYTSPAFLMQRLDRGTSGVIFFTKRADINARITRQFEKRQIEKTYLAIVEGELAGKETIDAPIRRAGAIKFAVGEGGRRAVTHIMPVLSSRAGSLLRIHLETGRTHQIRVHLAAIGHPLAGDWLYGVRELERPMLHAAEIEMTHPLTGQRLRVASRIPDDFRSELGRRGMSSLNGDETSTERDS